MVILVYDNPSVPLLTGMATGTGTLAMTGANVFWLALAAFAMIALGMALLRILPRRHTAPNAEDYLVAGVRGTHPR